MAPDVVLTQTGYHKERHNTQWARHDFSFRSALRTDQGETYMSAIAGRVPIELAVPLVSRGDRAGRADAVRYGLTEKFLAVGFDVTYQPTTTIPDHVAIGWSGEWEDHLAVKFCFCFTEYLAGPAYE